MSRVRLVILSNNTLFTRGIAARLRQFPGKVRLETLKPDRPDLLSAIMDINPAAVIMDATMPEIEANTFLPKLLASCPTTKIMQLDLQKNQISVMSCKQKTVENIEDLIDIANTV